MRTGHAERAAAPAVFAAAFAFLASGAYPWLAPRDAGDLALSALTLFPAHPPGYPLYSALGRAWLDLLPFGSAAYRLNLLSAAAAAAAAAVLFSWARKRTGALPAALLAAAFVAAGSVRKFGGLSEKYALQALFLAALVALSEGDERTEKSRTAAAGLLAGLGLVNHQSLLLALPGLALLYKPRRLPLAAAFAALGLAFNLFLVSRLGSVHEAWRAVTRAEYGTFELFAGLAAPLSFGTALALLAHWLAGAASPPALVLAAWSAPKGGRTALGLALAAAGLGPLFFLLSRFDVSGWVARSVLESAFVSSTLLVCALAALGLSGLPARLRAPLAALALAWSAAAGRRDGGHRDDFSAYDYAQSLRRAIAPGERALIAGDTALFTLRFAETQKPGGRALFSTFDADPRFDVAHGLGTDLIEQRGLKLQPEGLVQRPGRSKPGSKAWELAALRPGRALEADESYARDVRYSFAFARWFGGEPQAAAALAPADFDPK